MSNRVDLSSNGSSSTQASQELIKGLVEKGGFTQGNGAEDATSGAKADGKGKGTAKTNNAAKLTAPKAPAADGRQVDRVDTAASGGGAAAARNGGGSLNIGADTMHASRQAAEVGELATAAATAAPASDVPLVEDKNPKIAAAQKQLARDMADPSTSQEQLQRDVKNLVDVTKQQGRASDTLQLLNNAMPAGTSASKSGSIWEMAAKAGVDLDNNASKFKALKADTAVNKALRDQQKAQAASAAAAAGAGSGGGKAQAKDGGAQGSGGAGGSGEAKKSGPSGPSSWNGQKASASSATKDTSQAGGSKMSYSGPAENFPNDPGKWASWDDLWSKAAGSMAGANTPEQTQWVLAGIEKEAAATGIDKRFILAVVMQESGGNVNVRTTNNGVNNPGLMQSHNGASFDGSEASVMQMIKDGVEGTSSGDGLVQGLQQTNNLFAAARMYNSGQMNAGNLSDGMGATASYCADLANFVMGRG